MSFQWQMTESVCWWGKSVCCGFVLYIIYLPLIGDLLSKGRQCVPRGRMGKNMS